MTFPLIIADDEAASRVHDGRFSARLLEAPELDLDAVSRSAQAIAQSLPGGVKLCVAIKSQFCRPNLDRLGAWAASNDVEAIAVPSIDDAIQLRLAGATQRIVLLYVQDPRAAQLFARYACEPAAVSSWWVEQARRSAGRELPMHLWVDTGLGREGLLPDEAVSLGLTLGPDELRGLATHLAAVPYKYADGSLDKPAPRESPEFTGAQQTRFERVKTDLSAAGRRPQCHVASSAAIQAGLQWAMQDMARPGRVIVERFAKGRTRRALAIGTTEHHARIASVKELPAGWSVGYLAEPLTEPVRVATLVTAPGVRVGAGPISIVKEGRRHVLPLLLAHAGMCVVRAGSVPVEPGDTVDLNHPHGVAHHRFVPIAADLPRSLHDPLRDRSVAIGGLKRLALSCRTPNRSLAVSAARPRYFAPALEAAP